MYFRAGDMLLLIFGEQDTFAAYGTWTEVTQDHVPSIETYTAILQGNLQDLHTSLNIRTYYVSILLFFSVLIQRRVHWDGDGFIGGLPNRNLDCLSSSADSRFGLSSSHLRQLSNEGMRRIL